MDKSVKELVKLVWHLRGIVFHLAEKVIKGRQVVVFVERGGC